MIRFATALIFVTVFAGTWAMPQTSTADAISAQYPKGSIFTIQTDGIMATDSTCMLRPVSSFKHGKLHAPSFMQNAVLTTAKCTSQPLPAGVQVTLFQLLVKNGKVDFVLLACNSADCTQDNSYKTQVTFEFPKGILEASGLPVVQEAVSHVLASASADPAAGAAPTTPPVQQAPTAVSAHGEPLYSYVNTQSATDRLYLYQDGAFGLVENGQNYTGSYAVSGTTLSLHLAELQKDVDIAIKEKQLVVNGNETWDMETPGAISAQNNGPPPAPPSIDRIGRAVDEFLGQLKQKGEISTETTAVPSTAPVTLVNSSGSPAPEATSIFELKNASYACKSDDSGTKAAKKKKAYVLSARVTEKQAGHWFLTSVQMTVRECTPNPLFGVEIPVP